MKKLTLKNLLLLRLAYMAESLRFIAPLNRLAPPSFALKRDLCQKRMTLRLAEPKDRSSSPRPNRRGNRHK